jgi:hypothetical protein
LERRRVILNPASPWVHLRIAVFVKPQPIVASVRVLPALQQL